MPFSSTLFDMTEAVASASPDDYSGTDNASSLEDTLLAGGHWSSLARPVVDGMLELLQRVQPGSRHHVCMADLQTSNLVFSDSWFSHFVGSRNIAQPETDHYQALRISALVQAFKAYPAGPMATLMFRISELWQDGHHSGRLSIYHRLTAPGGASCPVVTQCQAAPMLVEDTGPILIANVTEVRHLSHPSPGPLLGASLRQANGTTHHWHLDPSDGQLIDKHFLSASEL